VCQILALKIGDFEQSTEQQYLGLVLLKEIIQTPLTTEGNQQKETSSNLVKQQFQKLDWHVKKLKSINAIKK